MAVSMVKIRKPFDMLINWKEYVSVLNQFFSEAEEDQVWAPAVDIKEKDGKYLLEADLPGVKEEDIHITYKNGYLTIEGRQCKAEDEDKVQNHMLERYYGRFQRVLKFPQDINESEIKINYKDGILEITIPLPDLEKQKIRRLSGKA